MKDDNRRLLYFDFISNLLTETKFLDMDQTSKLVTALLTLKNPFFPEVERFYNEITKGMEIDFDWCEGDRKKFFQIIELVDKNTNSFLEVLKQLQACVEIQVGKTFFAKKENI